MLVRGSSIGVKQERASNGPMDGRYSDALLHVVMSFESRQFDAGRKEVDVGFSGEFTGICHCHAAMHTLNVL
jgi:hypothetical protein